MIPIINTDKMEYCDPKNNVIIEDGRLVINHISLPVVYSCNQNCLGCVTHAPYLDGQPDFTHIAASIRKWATKITPKTVYVTGGEPLLHKNISHILYAVRQTWTDCTIILETNGHKLLEMPDFFWATVRNHNIKINIAVHKENSKAMLDGLNTIAKAKYITFTCYDYLNYWKTYWRYDDNNFPIINISANVPIMVFKQCTLKNVFTLHQLRLYRCSTMYGVEQLKKSYRWHKTLATTSTVPAYFSYDIERLYHYLTQDICSYELCGACTPKDEIKITQCQQLFERNQDEREASSCTNQGL